jgi:hypothetical protein
MVRFEPPANLDGEPHFEQPPQGEPPVGGLQPRLNPLLEPAALVIRRIGLTEETFYEGSFGSQ